ncbi:MAG: ABC transporter substrate-binding protein [Chloroflexus sp.]|uniref:peptide ABC transporter substrate-binding protein n=1 Tax=Chloroflexus sp. TaxID=1904827 RepID=UPI0021DE7073|nr:peptide ABC transporter substrate-binding protein [Chloroflexus sp.]GIV87739.1 MAG: ABC transporter substrate-binding protein [Chloroflexus sp.]
MARRIRWQLAIALFGISVIVGLFGRLAALSASTDNPAIGGTYREAVIGSPSVPIPLLNDPITDPTGRVLISLLFDGLTRIGIDGLIEPALAEGYTVDATGEIYTFKLRSGLRWHDGTPITTDDVIFTVRTLQELETPGEPALANFWRTTLVERVDNRTVRFILSGPFAPFPALARMPILPAHLLRGIAPSEWPTGDFARRLIGSGPFRLAELRADAAILTANPTYYNGRPFLDQIELRFMATPEAAVAALLRGEVMGFAERWGTNLKTVDVPGEERRIVLPIDEYTTLTFNLRLPLFQEIPLRRALALGLNRDALIETVLNGLAQPIDTPLLPGTWADDPTIRRVPADPTVAAERLAELDFEPGSDGIRQRGAQRLSFSLLVDQDERRLAVATAIAEQWRAIGVEVTVESVESTTLVERLRKGDFMAAIHTWTRIGPDPDVYSLWHSSQSQGWSELCRSERWTDRHLARTSPIGTRIGCTGRTLPRVSTPMAGVVAGNNPLPTAVPHRQ